MIPELPGMNNPLYADPAYNAWLEKQIRQDLEDDIVLFDSSGHLFTIDKSGDIVLVSDNHYRIGAFWVDLRGRNFNQIVQKLDNQFFGWQPIIPYGEE